jgi:hypothetical protein
VRYDWQWFCTLTIRPGIRPLALAQLFQDWIAAIKQDEGQKISWIRVIERGGLEGRLHIHALIAGTKFFSPTVSAEHWSDIAGDAVIGRHDPESECLQYTLKSIAESQDYDIDFDLSEKHLLNPAKLRRIMDDIHWRTWITKSNSNG